MDCRVKPGNEAVVRQLFPKTGIRPRVKPRGRLFRIKLRLQIRALCQRNRLSNLEWEAPRPLPREGGGVGRGAMRRGDRRLGRSSRICWRDQDFHARASENSARARCRKICAERQLVGVDLVDLIAPERMRTGCSPKQKTRRGISPARAQFQTCNYANSITPLIRQRRVADGFSFASGRFPARGRTNTENRDRRG